MTEFFYDLLKASFHGSIVILAVILLRQLLKKAPRSVFCLLWLLAGLRLVLPFEIESNLSLQPQVDAPELSIQVQQPVQVPDFLAPEADADLPEAAPDPVNPEDYENWQSESYPYKEEEGTLTPLTIGDIAAQVWILGMAAMVAASAVSYIRLKRRVRMAYLIENGCFECPGLDTAFVLGFLPPKIYLPAGLTDDEKKFIFDHENTHIARHDHWYKLLGYLVLSLHWFNPLVWIGYSLLCRDIELACDEHVVKYMSLAQRKAYSAALLACGGHTARIAACPVAFGESNPKKRILNVLNYKRPTFWISMLAIIAVIFVAVCLLTSPEKQVEAPEETTKWNLEMQVSDVTPSEAQVQFVQSGIFPGSDRAQLQYGSYYTLERWEDGAWAEVEMLPQEYDIAWTMEAYLIKLNSTNAFNVNWEWLYGELPGGRYRIGKDVDLFYRIEGETEHQMFYAEFEITEKSAPQASGEGRAYIALCREAMMTLKNSEELYLYITNLDDPMETTNVYMHASNGWLFKYRRPGWDYMDVCWLCFEGEQYIFCGDYDQNGQMTAPYYWKTDENTESHTYQLPYPFDLDWENIELSYDGTVEENGIEAVTVLFPLYLDAFTFYFSDRGELLYFDVGDSTGEPEATTSRCYVQYPWGDSIHNHLEVMYKEAFSYDKENYQEYIDEFYQELFARKTDGASTTAWIAELFDTFYCDAAKFVAQLDVLNKTNPECVSQVCAYMAGELTGYAPYLFRYTLEQIPETHHPEMLERLKGICMDGYATTQGICNDPECTDESHDHSGINCIDEHCTNSTHHHDDHHH